MLDQFFLIYESGSGQGGGQIEPHLETIALKKPSLIREKVRELEGVCFVKWRDS